jgi:hypothetical protein
MTTSTLLPVVLTGQALQSLRDSGYDLATALGEPIDNSIEADANKIQIRLDEATNSRGKKHIHRIIIADDGGGMPSDIHHRYLQLGFGTRYMSTDTIGKYGVGAKLAALNFGKRIDVWSRDDASASWMHVYFDLVETLEREQAGEETGIEEPTECDPPDDMSEMMPQGTGTIVVWSKVDRLEEGRLAADANELRVETEKEISRIFRYFIHDGIEISLNGKVLVHHDPLNLMEGSWTDKVMTQHLRKVNKKIPGDSHFPARKIIDEEVKIAGGSVRVRITLAHEQTIGPRGSGGDKLRTKLRIPENQGRISFIRLNREVSYTNVPKIFPFGVQDLDRYIGIEVSFRPTQDDWMGVRNVKRGVEPHGELRKKIRAILKKHLPTARNQLEETWGEIVRETREKTGEHGPITEAVKEADRTMPKSRVQSTLDDLEQQKALDDLAKDVVGSGTDRKTERAEYLEKIKGLPFVIESVDFPGTFFVDVQHIDGQVLIRLNTRHRFYREMWEPVREIAERDPGTVSGEEAVKAARRTIEALTLLLIAYGKAESMHEHPQEQYDELRSYWGMFVGTLMGKVKGIV